ncbi:MAG: PQQ-like beta-propeller repeat protein [Planctomycetes bacterium]|nr:PQQ-like beta-propeller repeat protein [Planctomycetota bacterium]
MPQILRSNFIYFLASIITAQTACAAEVEIRLLAGDQPNRPLVSDLVNFRRSPDGGLIAVEWISSVQRDGKPVFPIIASKGLVPSEPKAIDVGSKPTKTDLDDILNEIKKKPVRPTRPVDMIDSHFVGKTLTDGRKIGPIRQRFSDSHIAVNGATTITPGDITVTPAMKIKEVICYPVTITATQSGESVVFTPRLRYDTLDLLADSLFEHSPDLPLGDASPLARKSEGQLGWLEATQGGQRLFRKLTIYLPVSGVKPYLLNGRSFFVREKGIELSQESGSTGAVLKQRSAFHFEIVLPPAPSRKETVPLVVKLDRDWSTEQTHVDFDSAAQTLGEVVLNSARLGKRTLRPRLPSGTSGHPHVLLLAPAEPGAIPIIRTLVVPSSDDTRKGTLAIRIADVSDTRNLDLPAAFDGVLIANVNFRQTTEPRPGTDNKIYPLRFERQKSLDTWSTPLNDIPPGLYGLRLSAVPASEAIVPVVIVGKQTRASASLFTYHNRCDYLRGERVDLGIYIRALSDVKDLKAKLILRHESGEEHVAATIDMTCLAGQAVSRFVTIETAGRRLGKYTISLQSDAELLTYGAEFTVFSDDPKSLFALPSWMSSSFSGPIKAADKPLANIVLGQKPSASLTPSELARLTAQPAFPATWQSSCRRDPFYPAPATTETYDVATERELAIAMRLGMRYAPDYGWGMNSQEAQWNPKHTLADDLSRIQRLCSHVTERHRDFGNFAGLHLNWYAQLYGYWEDHPATDGNVAPRRQQLEKEVASIYAETDADKTLPDGSLVRAVRAHDYRIGALSRAYDHWTRRARTLSAGVRESTAPTLTSEERQPGLTGEPVYTSFAPISWFSQRNYYPTSYFRTLPVAGVHAYTDYGFSPFQAMWGVDYWAAGIGEKPVWATSMSNGRDIMIGQALLLAGRGASGIDLHGDDPATAGVITDFLTSYGSFFRTLRPHSEVAIVTSLRQQLGGESKQLVGQWMGYTGGTYYDLYTKLWYVRRPPAMLPEEAVTPEVLAKFKAVFLVGQKVPLPETAMKALRTYSANGGRIFKDAETLIDVPGEVFDLTPDAKAKPSPWIFENYVATRDRMFVGTQAGYEASSAKLQAMLGKLTLPLVDAPDNVLLATLQPKATAAESRPSVAAVVFAVNDTHPWPGIQHPWNFWSATIMASRSKLSFDRPYVIYDLLNGGKETILTEKEDGRFVLPVEFDRCAGVALLAATAPIRAVRVRTLKETYGGSIPLEADVQDQEGRVFDSPIPCEITLIDDKGKIVETLFRALGPNRSIRLNIPREAAAGLWRVRVRELASGRTETAEVRKIALEPAVAAASPVLMPRPTEVSRFLNGGSKRPVLILLDARQVEKEGEKLSGLVTAFAAQLKERGRDAEVRVVDTLDLVELPLRWQPTSRDQIYLKEAAAGKRVLVTSSLHAINERGMGGAAGRLDTLHPECGWLEPGAKHRIAQDVVLLGNAEHSRFLADLHQSVGMKAEGLLAPGSAMVQVIHDAFSADGDCLSIQAADLDGLSKGIAVVQGLKPSAAINAPPVEQPPLTEWVGKEVRPLPNPVRDVFGEPVQPLAFTSNGGLLVAAGTQAANYFLFDAEGKLQRKWLGKYAVELGDPEGKGLWMREWWGVPGYINSVVRADQKGQSQWRMELPAYGRGYQNWRHSGQRTLVDPVAGDLYVAGRNTLTRITAAGQAVWQYNDLETSHDVESFRFARDLMLHGISGDGRYLLAAAFGIEPYGNTVSRFVRPVVFLFDTRTGKVIWEKPDVLIDQSACGFVGDDRIVIADSTAGRKRVMILDLKGRELWSQHRPQGVSEAKLSPDGKWLMIRPEAPRGTSFAILGSPEGMQTIRLPDDLQSPSSKAPETRSFVLSDHIHSWRMLPASGNIIVSTADGNLTCFRPDATVVWSKRLSGPATLLDAPGGKQIAVGTRTGSLLMLDGDGNVVRTTDLMVHNIVTDIDQYVRDYTASPAAVPLREPHPASPPRIQERHGNVVKFSANLLAKEPGAQTKGITVAKEATTFRVAPGAAGTYVLSLLQRTTAGRVGDPSEHLLVEVREVGAKIPLVLVRLPMSSLWEERTISWRLKKPAECSISLKYQGKADGVEVREAGLFTVKYPSVNVLYHRPLDAPKEPTKDDVDALLGAETITLPSMLYFMPNDVDLAARSRGAPPFRAVVPFTQPFDGQLTGQPTSWLSRPLGGSTHAQLQMTYKTPMTLTALAVYEDPSAEFSDTYAILCRDAKTKLWSRVGHVVGNRSPFNLFTFKPMTVDAVTYLWLKSADGHVRIAEMEAYRPAAGP